VLLFSYHEAFRRHDTGPGHPESPRRLDAILAHLDETGIRESARAVESKMATREDIDRVHIVGHYDSIDAACARTGHIDVDTHVGRDSFDAALRAAGSTLAVADEVMDGRDSRGFCLVRPPGHHATPGIAMGFCLFNNVAVCARYLQAAHGLSRVAIVDFDVHHGNGTEDVFRDDETVFYLSSHRYPFYPGTGGPHRGGNPPKATCNVTLPAHTTPEEFHTAFARGMDEVSAFAPEAIVVSAGFDAHEDDPIGGLNLTIDDFARITDLITAVAARTANGRIISALEGGYGVRALGPCVAAHLQALA
jgi:acetoin utilization deacetylase AcuC-like enzyme